jgi:MFS superfamily sulfate permease-like transporter
MKDTVFVWTLTDIIGLCILGICLVIAIIFGIFYAFASLIDKMKHIYNKRKQP